jgi:hypothetical protein
MAKYMEQYNLEAILYHYSNGVEFNSPQPPLRNTLFSGSGSIHSSVVLILLAVSFSDVFSNPFAPSDLRLQVLYLARDKIVSLNFTKRGASL